MAMMEPLYEAPSWQRYGYRGAALLAHAQLVIAASLARVIYVDESSLSGNPAVVTETHKSSGSVDDTTLSLKRTVRPAASTRERLHSLERWKRDLFASAMLVSAASIAVFSHSHLRRLASKVAYVRLPRAELGSQEFLRIVPLSLPWAARLIPLASLAPKRLLHAKLGIPPHTVISTVPVPRSRFASLLSGWGLRPRPKSQQYLLDSRGEFTAIERLNSLLPAVPVSPQAPLAVAKKARRWL